MRIMILLNLVFLLSLKSKELYNYIKHFWMKDLEINKTTKVINQYKLSCITHWLTILYTSFLNYLLKY